jgi:orotate phosphoribosyltransferase
VVVVDDVLTTGGSVKGVIEAARALGGDIAGVAVLIDRSAGCVDFGVPFFACLDLDLPTYDAAECPHCERGEPLVIT